MIKRYEQMKVDYGIKTVATGIWLYDKTIPRKIELTSRPAKFSSTRFDEDDQLDEARPVPSTPDGNVYHIGTFSREFHTIEEAMNWTARRIRQW